MALRFSSGKVRIASRSSFGVIFFPALSKAISPLKYSSKVCSCRASSKVMSEKVTSFALCLRSSLWVSQASLCSTVLQNFWKAHCFINSLRLGSTFSPPFSLESWWCFPLFAGQYCLLKKTPKIFGFFSKNFLSSKIRLSEKPGQTYRYCKRYSDD